MAATPQSQQRCVFVGNIPYDATEEQLVQICEEVGPVVSFRLVVDRETGKPKGYGFCEYKDEETALSARRNLQGYEINGRQLRVDFAENGKNVDRATGRAGPGTISNPDPQKQSGGVAVPGYSSLHQPMGDSVAAAASTVMAGALGATHGSNLNPTGWQGQILSGNDPLTSLLAKMSRSQLTEVISELKAMTLQNKEQVRQLLLAIPNLPRALFQAQIMLGMVTPQMLQMANIRQAPAQSDQPLMQTTQTVSRLPPLSLDKVKVGYQPHAHESQASASNLPTQYAAPVQQIPAQSQIQRPQLIQNQVIRQNQPLQQSKALSLPHARPQPVGVRPYVEAPTSSSFRQHEQPSSLQNIIGQPQLAKASVPTHSSGVSKGAINVVTPMSTSFPVSHVSARQSSMADETVGGKTQVTQLQLPSDLDSTLLQQVLNLTPEQLSSLPLDQQQQVIQLQQMLSKVA